MIGSKDKASRSFLKKRTKKLLFYGIKAGSAGTPISKSFCFFFQKEALTSFAFAIASPLD
jgi:hypothetical protein